MTTNTTCLKRLSWTIRTSGSEDRWIVFTVPSRCWWHFGQNHFSLEFNCNITATLSYTLKSNYWYCAFVYLPTAYITYSPYLSSLNNLCHHHTYHSECKQSLCEARSLFCVVTLFLGEAWVQRSLCDGRSMQCKQRLTVVQCSCTVVGIFCLTHTCWEQITNIAMPCALLQ